jgi:hypothetical protein
MLLVDPPTYPLSPTSHHPTPPHPTHVLAGLPKASHAAVLDVWHGHLRLLHTQAALEGGPLTALVFWGGWWVDRGNKVGPSVLFYFVWGGWGGDNLRRILCS